MWQCGLPLMLVGQGVNDLNVLEAKQEAALPRTAIAGVRQRSTAEGAWVQAISKGRLVGHLPDYALHVPVAGLDVEAVAPPGGLYRIIPSLQCTDKAL